jgi:hypothetical protein
VELWIIMSIVSFPQLRILTEGDPHSKQDSSPKCKPAKEDLHLVDEICAEEERKDHDPKKHDDG